MRAVAHRGVRGAVYVELLIVLWPLSLLWLGLGQLGLLYAADILVEHAAARAVRAAIVILPDDHPGWEDRYAGVEPLTLGGSGDGLEGYSSAPDGGRLELIRRAARITLSSISPGIGGSVPGSLLGYVWTDWAVAVTFPSGSLYQTEFAPTQRLSARVTYLFPCVVPLVDRLMCSSYYGFEAELSPQVRDALSSQGRLDKVKGRLDRGLDERARRELDTVDGWILGAAGLGLALGGFPQNSLGASRFIALTAEQTMPMQGRQK